MSDGQRVTKGPRRERLAVARVGGIAGLAATAMLVTAPGVMAAPVQEAMAAPNRSDPCDEVVSHTMRADCHADDLDPDDFPHPGSDAKDADADAAWERGGESGEGVRPGRPGPWAEEPGAPEAKGRVHANLVRGTSRVHAGATVKYRLELDVRGTVGAVTVDLETNLGTWLFADVVRTGGASLAEEGSGRTEEGAGRTEEGAGRTAEGAGRAEEGAVAGLRCAVVGGERVRCSADELKGPGRVKLRLRLPERTDVPELRVSGQVTSDGAVDAFTDTAAPLATAAPKDDRDDGQTGGHGDQGTKDTDGAKNAEGAEDADGTDGTDGAKNAEDAEDANGTDGIDGADGANSAKNTKDDENANDIKDDEANGHASHETRPGTVLPEIPRPALPPICTVNVASLPLDDSPPRLPEVGPVGMPGAAPQRPAPAAAHRTRPVARATSAEDRIPDGAAIALGLGGLAVLLAGGLYGRSALRKD